MKIRHRYARTLLGLPLVTFLLVTACQPDRAELACRDPMPQSPEWWQWIPIEEFGGTESFQAPTAPGFIDDPTDWLEGSHALMLWSTIAPTHPDSLRAALTLGRVAANRYGELLDGIAILDREWPDFLPLDNSGPLSSPTSVWWRSPGAVHLRIGSTGPDTGVVLYFFSIGPTMAVGRWISGGHGVIAEDGGEPYTPQGYFCLVRADTVGED